MYLSICENVIPYPRLTSSAITLANVFLIDDKITFATINVEDLVPILLKR